MSYSWEGFRLPQVCWGRRWLEKYALKDFPRYGGAGVGGEQKSQDSDQYRPTERGACEGTGSIKH